jgi:zinc transport system permease protein
VEWWYSLVDLLPFEWAEPGRMMFMKNALLAVIIITPLLGLLSTIIVNNRMAFFSDALGHGAFTGIVIGAITGAIEPLWAAVIFSIIFALIVSFVRSRSRLTNDTVIGVFSSISVALGIFLATAGGKNFAKLNRYLIGDLLSITPSELLSIFVVLLIVIVLWVFLINKFVVISIHKSLAGSRGINVLWIEILFSVIIAIVVTFSLSWVGLLVINAMVVLPGSIARNVAGNIRKYNFISVISALITGICGLIISYYFGTVAGATIVLFLGGVFLMTFILKRRFE